MLILRLLFLSVYVTCRSYHYIYESDGIGRPDKWKMLKVALELVKDANLKLRMVTEIRDSHAGYMAFDIGLIMGNIREKYRRMLETYREIRDKDSGRSLFVPSSIWSLRPAHFIIAMENVHTLEHSIDKLVHVLETIVSEDFNPDPRYTTRKRSKRTRKGDTMAMLRTIEEEELKSSNREQSLQHRLGVTGHTARRRFQTRWPVDGSWTMGQYGDMGVYDH